MQDFTIPTQQICAQLSQFGLNPQDWILLIPPLAPGGRLVLRHLEEGWLLLAKWAQTPTQTQGELQNMEMLSL